MEKGLEFFDAWVKSQKEFLEAWTKSQGEFMAHWKESQKKLQESFETFGSKQEGSSKEMKNLFNSLFNTMANSAKIFSEEVVKIQETGKNTFEKQMEMNREMVTSFSQFFKQATDKQSSEKKYEKKA